MISSFPVIGVAVVNGATLLHRLIESVDFPTQEFVIFDNSGNESFASELRACVDSAHAPSIGTIKLCHLPHNVGCAGAWNLIIKSYMMSPYWIISTPDIAFTPGLLQDMAEKASIDDVGMVHIQEGNFRGSFECFLIKDWVVQNFGLFDENFYPAYVEDCDYLMRVDGKIRREYLNKPFWHGDTMSYEISGGQTLRNSNDETKQKIKHAHYINEVEYMPQKWGADWRNWNRYSTPFNAPNYTVGYSYYNLALNRKKYMGF